MGKFAGFWNRIKKFGPIALDYFVKGTSKLNDLYKQYRPIIHEATKHIPYIGQIAGPVINYLMDGVSSKIDFQQMVHDLPPNTFISTKDIPKDIRNRNGPVRVGKISQQDLDNLHKQKIQ